MSTFSQSRRRVLIVDDEWLMREMLADVLEEMGFATSLASSAAEALRLMRREPAIDLVITDVEMPGVLNGVDLARVLISQRPELGMLIVSGCRAPALPPGVRFLAKPFMPAELSRTLNELALPRVRAAS